MTETPVVVNLFTHQSDWSPRVREALQSKREVILLGIPSEPERAKEISRLCEEAGYTAPQSISESDWAKRKEELNLGGLATKEQALTPNSIFVARPR